jgi:hypothetical protein
LTGRNETIIKWVLFGSAALLTCLLQGFVQHLVLFGVLPFLFPALVAMVGMYEGSVPGTIFGLVLGVLCDLTVSSAIPCFYTLIFPLIGLVSALIAQFWIPAGFLCALVSSVFAFAMTDGSHALVLALTGHPAWASAGIVAAKETALTLPFAIPVFLLLRAIHVKCHQYD